MVGGLFLTPTLLETNNMTLDPVTNFANVQVGTGYASGVTSIVLRTGEGIKLPDPATDGEFNVVWFDSTNHPEVYSDPNVEIVRVTAKSVDTLTVTRGQEGTGDSSKNVEGLSLIHISEPTRPY